MKFLKFAAMAALLLGTLTACSDDDKGPGSTEDLIGTWQTVTTINWEKEDGQLIAGSTDEEPFDNMRLSFEEDGTFTVYHRYSTNSSWSTTETGKFKYSGGKISVKYDGDTDWEGFCVVKQLTESTMVTEEYFKEYDEGTLWEEYNKTTFRKVSGI